METKTLTTWAQQSLVEYLVELQRLRPHAPTLNMVAIDAVTVGLKALAAGPRPQLARRAVPKGRRRALTLRLPRLLGEKVLRLTRVMPDAPTPSSALCLALWVGVNRLLDESRPASVSVR